MKRFYTMLLCMVMILAACSPAVRTPEQSSLFEKRVDSISGVVSYALKYGAPDDNRQSLYFITKSMTDDGRFLVFWYNEGNELKGIGARRLMLADLAKDRIYDIGPAGMIPFIENREDYVIYGDVSRGFFRRNFKNPGKEIFLCGIPTELSSLGEVLWLATHLTLTQDRKKAFLDTGIKVSDDSCRYIQGLLNLEDGSWDLWGETEWLCNHGQLNPRNDSLALCAWENAWENLGKEYTERTGIYPRMWLVRKGSKTLVPAEARNFASHEIWDDDGNGFSWCGHGWIMDEDCVYHSDLATGRQEKWATVPGARHDNCSPDNRYVVCDQSPLGWWRGCPWRVAFFNRGTGKYVWIYETREALMPRDNQSKLHPDPHPHFVCGGKYVVCTANNADGHMDLYVTPVDQLVEMTQ